MHSATFTFLGTFIKQRSIFSNSVEISRGRIGFLFVSFIFMFSILSMRLFFITVMPNLSLGGSPNVQDGQYTLLSARRDIVDRNGELLATNISTSSVYANPRMIRNPKAAARKLQAIFPDMNSTELATKLQSEKSFVWIKRFITPTEQQRVNDIGIPGLHFEMNERRAYTYGRLFSHIIGNVGSDGDGMSGLEKFFDENLKYKKSDASQEPLALSLDASIQNIVREEVKSAVTEFNAKGGVGIVQNPNTGEILAIVSLPDFNPYAISKTAPNDLFNKATLGTYEVGSVLKSFTVAAGIDSGKVNMNDVYDVDAPIQMAKYQIKDFQRKNRSHLSVPEILMYSSNIGTAQIALELGKRQQFNYLKAFGFMSQSELEISEKSKPLYPAFDKWSDLSSITISYGNGISVSPLHVVNAASSLINGGKLYPATIMKVNGQPKYTQVLKESTSDLMRKMFRLVVKSGSGRKGDVEGYFVGGKTGTSNKIVNGKYSNSLRVSSFVAAFPMHSPKYVVYVMLDEPHSTKDTYGFATGGWTAAPAVSKIIKRMALLYNIAPEMPDKDGGKIEHLLHVNYDASGGASGGGV